MKLSWKVAGATKPACALLGEKIRRRRTTYERDPRFVVILPGFIEFMYVFGIAAEANLTSLDETLWPLLYFASGVWPSSDGSTPQKGNKRCIEQAERQILSRIESVAGSRGMLMLMDLELNIVNVWHRNKHMPRG